MRPFHKPKNTYSQAVPNQATFRPTTSYQENFSKPKYKPLDTNFCLQFRRN